MKHCHVDYEEDSDQPEDIVIQPDLLSVLEEDSMNESRHEIEDEFDNDVHNDNTAHSNHDYLHITNPSWRGILTSK